MLRVFIFSFLLLSSTVLRSQCTTANPTCATAVSLTPGDPCVDGSVCNGGSVYSQSCGGGTNSSVWYSFVASSTDMNVDIDWVSGNCNFKASIYSGSCPSPTEITCQTGSPSAFFTLTGLVIGQTYYVQVHGRAGGACGTGVEFCISLDDAAITNDDPCGAVMLPVSTVCSYATYWNTTSTDSGVPDPGCANYQGSDVWFSVVVPASGEVDIELNTGDIIDGGAAAYSGSCSSLTLISCDDNTSSNGSMPLLSLTGLTGGSTIWIRVWEDGGDVSGTFDICAIDPNVAPANDEPCNAQSIAVNSSCVFETFSNESSTGSAGIPAPGCANYVSSDVWFSITVPGTGNVEIDFNTGTMIDAGAAAYSGTCSSLSLIACDDVSSANGDMPLLTLIGLTPGATIWIRVWEYGDDNNGTFDICATELASCSPTNTSCSSAIALTSNSACINGSTCGGGAVEPLSCPTGSTEGVWYSFLATQTDMNVFVQLITTTGCYFATSVYSGSCGSLTEIGCESAAPANDAITLSGLTVGSTYYVQVSYPPGGPCGNNGYAEFCINAEDVLCEGGGNNSCGTADPFCTGTSYTYCNTTGAGNLGSYANFCLGSTPNPMWMFFQIDNPGQIDIQITQFDNFGGTLDVDFALWGPFTDVTAACAAISPSTPAIDCSYSVASIEYANINAVQTGDIYMLLVTNYSNTAGYLELVQYNGLGTTDCSIILPCSISGVASDISCFGLTDGEIAASWDGAANYTVELTDGAGNQVDILSNIVTTSHTFTNLSNDTYTLTVTSSDGCTNSSIVTVNQPAAVSLTLDDTNPTCVDINSGSIGVTVSSSSLPVNVSWTGTSSGDPVGNEITSSGGSYTVSSLTAGSYTFTAVDNSGCTASASITLSDVICASPTVSLPVGLPSTLDCASADSYATPADATYTNSDIGTCLISGTLSPTVTDAFDACNGGTITIDYAVTDACGNALTAQHVITVSPPASPTVSLPVGLPSTLDCASADSYATPAGVA